MIAARISLLTFLILTLVFPCEAQSGAKDTPAARAVKMFNVFCLSQLPDLDGVKKAAGFGEFAPITGDELKTHVALEPGTSADALHAWRFHEAAGEFILTAVQSKPDDRAKKEAPAFANAKRYACTLTFPPADARQVVAELNALLKRQPSATRSDGAASVHTWTHATAKHLSRVEFHAAAGAAPARLTASVLVKP